MKKLLILSAVLICAASSVLAESNTKAPAPKFVISDKDKTASCCDTDCDGKTVCTKKAAKPVAMSPKAAAEAGMFPLIAAK